MNMSTANLPDLAAEQDGLVTREQAIAAGFGESAIRHALGPHGKWQKIVAGVYATFTGSVQERHRLRAALLRAGPDAVVTGEYACRSYGMRFAPKSTVVEVLIPHSVTRAQVDIARIRRARHMPPTRMLDGIPCASPERAALDSARSARSLRDARAVVCEVVQRRLATVDRVVEEFARVDQRRMRFARQALSDVQAGCRSAPECELRDLVLTSDVLPQPVWNQPLPDDSGLIPDGYIQELRLALEVESMEFHQFGAAPEATERRRARYASLGWRVYPVSPRRIREEPAVVLAEIEAAALAHINHAA